MTNQYYRTIPHIDAPLPEIDTKPRIDTEYVIVDDAELDRRYRVIIENDDTTPMEFVVMVLVVIFELSSERAFDVMLTAHNEGRAHVVTLPFEEARQRVYAAQSSAREAGYPLSFYLEPDS
ncbi:MAG: ATP-dependent Clp protease adaptor ClpS [Roseiflexaceae bacterium]|nr:ATP-dependent Clp protease adaptor ClpS [Roseiflexaceae bacterium]